MDHRFLLRQRLLYNATDQVIDRIDNLMAD